jgi:hypothetical protein
MALNVKVGHLVKPGTLGDQDVTGAGFDDGKAVLVIPTDLTGFGWKTMGVGTSCRSGVGAATAIASRGVATVQFQDAGTPPLTRRSFKSNRFVSLPKKHATMSTTVLSCESDFKAFIADGFRHEWLNVDEAGGFLMPYMILGGSDITVEAVRSWQFDDAPLPVPVTGVGGQPKLALNFFNGRTSEGLGGKGAFCIGAMGDDGTQFALMGYSKAQANPTLTGRWALDNHCVCLSDHEASFQNAVWTSMDGDGLTVTMDDPSDPTDRQLCQTLALGGTFRYKIVSFAKDDTPVIEGVDTPALQHIDFGFPLRGMILATAMKTAGATVVDHNRIGFGFFDGTDLRWHCWTDQHGLSTSNVETHLSQTRIVIADNNLGASDAEGVPTLAGNGCDISWVKNNAVETQVFAVGVGDAEPGDRDRVDDLALSDSVAAAASLERLISPS